jgi:hypothetical protein
MGSLVGASDDVKRAGIESSLNDYTVSLRFPQRLAPLFTVDIGLQFLPYHLHTQIHR